MTGVHMRSRIIVAIVITAAIARGARADSVTISFPGLTDGSYFFGSATAVDTGFWVLAAQPFATVIGPGNPSFTGTPGIDFGGTWSLKHTDATATPAAVELDSISATFDLVSLTAPPIAINGQVELDTTPVTGWAWTVTTPGTLTEDLAGIAGDTVELHQLGPVASDLAHPRLDAHPRRRRRRHGPRALHPHPRLGRGRRVPARAHNDPATGARAGSTSERRPSNKPATRRAVR